MKNLVALLALIVSSSSTFGLVLDQPLLTPNRPKPARPQVQHPQYQPQPQGPCAVGQGAAREVCELVNQIRQSQGLHALVLDPVMNQVALRYAQEMYSTGNFSHTGVRGDRPTDRLRAGGVRFRMAAENIAMNSRGARAVVTGWWNSDGHRRNMLSPRARRHGIGEYGRYWVHVFAD